MRSYRKMASGVVLGLAAVGGASAQQADPYLWLEDVGGDKALSWVREQNAAALQEIAKSAANLAGIVVAVPARRAPIKAIALFLKNVVAAGGSVETVLLLLGHHTGDAFTPVNDAEFVHWKNFNAIHHLHLGLEKWRPS